MIKFYCQHCGAKISAELSDAGVAASCPSCGEDLVVPTGSAELVATPPEALTHEAGAKSKGSSTDRYKPGKSVTGRMIKIGVISVLCILVTWGIVAAVRSKGGETGDLGSESAPAHAVQPKQKTNRAGYNAYMTGYNDPEQGEVAEAMIDQFTGGDRQAALLMILGAEDKRKGLPIRFVVVAE
jgi:DNA-directed RNA polymerase subunit RPC12/RpoP